MFARMKFWPVTWLNFSFQLVISTEMDDIQTVEWPTCINTLFQMVISVISQETILEIVFLVSVS